MTINELIEELEYMKEMCSEGGNTEIRFAAQPSWPFEYSVSSVLAMTQTLREQTLRAEMLEEGYSGEEINENLCDLDISPDVVYLVEGSQLGYLPSDVKNECGW